MATVSSNNNLRRSSRKRGNSEISHQSEPSLTKTEDSAGSSSEQIMTTATVPTEVSNGVEKQSGPAAAAVGAAIKSEDPPIKQEEGNASSSSASEAMNVKPAAKATMSAGEGMG